MFKVLVTEKLGDSAMELMGSVEGMEVVCRFGMERDVLEDCIADFDALVVRTYTQVDKALIDKATSLKLIVRKGVGLDNVDVKYAESKGIAVKNTPRANYISVAEHVFALLLSSMRRIVPADAYTKTALGWDRDLFVGRELHGKILGLVGIGLIGSHVAQIARAFGMSVIAYDPYIDKDRMKELGADKRDNLNDLASEADIISVHVPLFDSTRGLVSKDMISSMKPSALLVNTSRGPVVDNEALIKVLSEKSIAGACLDVYDTEPPTDKRLLSLDNVILTPHIGAKTEEAEERMDLESAGAVVSFFNEMK